MKQFPALLRQDHKIRQLIYKTVGEAGIDRVVIKRSQDRVIISLYAARPGLIIGRRGGQIKDLEGKITKLLEQENSKQQIKIEVNQIKDFESHASLVANELARAIEKRISYRRAMKQAISRVMKNYNIEGIKVEIAGRLNGADMSRREYMSQGKVPLQTLRADIDYCQTEALTKYGVVGIKVWIYRGKAKSSNQD